MTDDGKLAAIRESRQEVWETARRLAGSAAAENRNFTGDERAAWDNLMAALDVYDRQISALTAVRPRFVTRDEARAAHGLMVLGDGPQITPLGRACAYCRCPVTGHRCANCGAPARL